MKKYQDTEDIRIVELFQKRDEDAVAAASKKYGAALRSIAFNVLRDEGEAEECENDAYLKAWNSIPPEDPQSYLFAYLARLVRTSAIDRLRRHGAEKRNIHYAELTEEIENSIPSLLSVEDEIDAKLLSDAVSRFL